MHALISTYVGIHPTKMKSSQHLKLLRKSNNKTPNANRTIPDSNGSSQKKPDTASKKRGRNDQNDDGDASATEAKPPSKKRATKSKVKAEE